MWRPGGAFRVRAAAAPIASDQLVRLFFRRRRRRRRRLDRRTDFPLRIARWRRRTTVSKRPRKSVRIWGLSNTCLCIKHFIEKPD